MIISQTSFPVYSTKRAHDLKPTDWFMHWVDGQNWWGVGVQVQWLLSFIMKGNIQRLHVLGLYDALVLTFVFTTALIVEVNSKITKQHLHLLNGSNSAFFLYFNQLNTNKNIIILHPLESTSLIKIKTYFLHPLELNQLLLSLFSYMI